LTQLRASAILNFPFQKQLREQSKSQALQEESMPSDERRSAARKSYAIPVRFNVRTEQYAMVGAASAASGPARANAKILTAIPLPQQGEIVNLSERGIGFKTKQNLNVGESVEIFFYAADGLDRTRTRRRALQCARGTRGQERGH
jgi:hypothetical protein